MSKRNSRSFIEWIHGRNWLCTIFWLCWTICLPGRRRISCCRLDRNRHRGILVWSRITVGFLKKSIFRWKYVKVGRFRSSGSERLTSAKIRPKNDEFWLKNDHFCHFPWFWQNHLLRSSHRTNSVLTSSWIRFEKRMANAKTSWFWTIQQQHEVGSCNTTTQRLRVGGVDQ